jgi:hypothetical protein
MEYIVAIIFSILLLWSYRRGIADGIRLSDGKAIEPIRSPVAVVQEYKENKEVKKQQDLINEGISNIFSYDPQKKGGG